MRDDLNTTYQDGSAAVRFDEMLADAWANRADIRAGFSGNRQLFIDTNRLKLRTEFEALGWSKSRMPEYLGKFVFATSP